MTLNLRECENSERYHIQRDFILDEGMKPVNFETPDFKKKVKELFAALAQPIGAAFDCLPEAAPFAIMPVHCLSKKGFRWHD